jgi:hypothetical protein
MRPRAARAIVSPYPFGHEDDVEFMSIFVFEARKSVTWSSSPQTWRKKELHAHVIA